jgi:hypothetical protein
VSTRLTVGFAGSGLAAAMAYSGVGGVRALADEPSARPDWDCAGSPFRSVEPAPDGRHQFMVL